MNKLKMIITISVLALAGAAYAEGAADMGKPAPELKKEYDGMIGSWKCEGKASMGGKEMKGHGTMKASWDLDGHWVVSQVEGRAEGMPGVHKSHDMYGYDATKKQFVMVSIDNMGGWGTMTSSGWQGDKEEWTGKATMMGQESEIKYTITRKSPKEVTISGAMGTDKFENVCKK